MKNKFLVLVVALLTCIVAVSVVACKSLESLEMGRLPESFENMDVAEGKSALAIFNEAHDNFLAESNYRRVQYYDFATVAGTTQSMQIKTTRKIDANKIYNEEVVLAAGVMSLNEGKKVYFDDKNAYSMYFNDKKRVTGSGDDVFAVESWDKLGTYDAERYGAVEETKTNYRNQLVLYNLDSVDYLAQDSDDKVYTQDDKLYFTLKIDCSDTAMNGVQKAVAEAIAKKTASSPKDLKMKTNTVIRAEVKKIDGKYRFTLLQINEEYNGKLTIFKAECKTTYYNEFYYEKGAGTANDADLYGIGN